MNSQKDRGADHTADQNTADHTADQNIVNAGVPYAGVPYTIDHTEDPDTDKTYKKKAFTLDDAYGDTICDKVRSVINDYLIKDLSETEAVCVKKHLFDCADCQNTTTIESAISNMLKRCYSNEKAPRELVEKIHTLKGQLKDQAEK
jgi:anti-sigma factor (TIGR02949 family)